MFYGYPSLSGNRSFCSYAITIILLAFMINIVSCSYSPEFPGDLPANIYKSEVNSIVKTNIIYDANTMNVYIVGVEVVNNGMYIDILFQCQSQENVESMLGHLGSILCVYNQPSLYFQLQNLKGNNLRVYNFRKPFFEKNHRPARPPFVGLGYFDNNYCAIQRCIIRTQNLHKNKKYQIKLKPEDWPQLRDYQTNVQDDWYTFEPD